MGRALTVLHDDHAKAKAIGWVKKAPYGTRVEFKSSQRTLPQNDHMWALLTDIARQATLHGNRYTTDQWKVIFLHALGRETQFLPALEGADFIPYGQSSSDLGKQEMSDLLDLIYAWGTQNNIQFSSGANTSSLDAPATANSPSRSPTGPECRSAGGGNAMSRMSSPTSQTGVR